MNFEFVPSGVIAAVLAAVTIVVVLSIAWTFSGETIQTTRDDQLVKSPSNWFAGGAFIVLAIGVAFCAAYFLWLGLGGL